MKTIGAIFGGGGAKPQGPDPAMLAAQQAQEDRLKKQEEETTKRTNANRALIAARSGRGAGITLNPSTGERGVSDTLG